MCLQSIHLGSGFDSNERSLGCYAHRDEAVLYQLLHLCFELFDSHA